VETFRRIDAWVGRAYHVVGNLVGISIGLFALAISIDLGLRQSGIGNLPGMQEVIEYALYAGVFLAAPWVLRLGAHVRVDLILAALPAKTMTKIERAIDVFGVLTCCVLGWYAWKNLLNAYASGALQRQQFNIPEWFILSFLVIGMLLLAIEFIFRIIRAGSPPEASEDEEGGL